MDDEEQFEKTTEEAFRKKGYEEFVLEELDQQNLEEIEKTIKADKINDTNKEGFLEYLMELHKKIREVKKAELEYEGEENINVNKYLYKVEELIKKVNTY